MVYNAGLIGYPRNTCKMGRLIIAEPFLPHPASYSAAIIMTIIIMTTSLIN